MCTTTDVNKPRQLRELLSLETYQGMTDEEIDIILEYKIEQELTSTMNLAKLTAIEAAQTQIVEDNRRSAEQASNVINYIVENTFNAEKPIQRLTFEPYVMEV